jgi:hypothetical protein
MQFAKDLTFIGVNYGCSECARDAPDLSKGYDAVAIGFIRNTKSNIESCQGLRDGLLDVSQFIPKLNEYAWKGWRDCLLIYTPLFKAVKERKQNILPMRPCRFGYPFDFTKKRLDEYLTNHEKLAVVIERVYMNFFRNLSYPIVEKRVFDVHLNHREP